MRTRDAPGRAPAGRPLGRLTGLAVHGAVQTAVSWPPRVKVGHQSADGKDVLFLLALLTAAYFSAVIWLRGRRRDAAGAGAEKPVGDLPVEDRPPPTAVGWPPGGRSFASYVDDGFAAIDAWLSEGHTA